MPRMPVPAPCSPGARQVRSAVLLAALLALCSGFGAKADYTCQDGAGIRILGTPALAFHDSYNPFASTDLSETITIGVANHSPATCELGLVFITDDGDGALARGSQTLAYALETLDGTPLLRHAGMAAPEAGAHILITLPPGETAAASLRGRIPAGQMTTPGAYADGTLELRVYQLGQAGGFATLLNATGIPVSADVAGVCKISPPAPATIDFSDDIGANGRPIGNARSVQLPEAACNTGARLKLSGMPLQREGDSSIPGFDGFINFEAEANFGAVGAALITAQDDSPDEAISGPTPGATTAPIDITLRLHAGRSLAAGHYSGTLSIALEPSP